MMTERQSVRTQGVVVPYTSEHDEKTVGWLNSADIQATFGRRPALSLDSHRRWVLAATDTRIWAILGPAGQHVGNVLLKINERLGLGERAFLSVLKAAYEGHSLHRVWLHTFAENVRAEALYQKYGFVLEGVEREALWMDGTYVSQRRWSLLANEWRGAVGAGEQP